MYTIMVYMCGTDLESNYGMATSDINEMLHADLSDKVNIIVETGGADKWQNTVISSKVNQIYQVKNEGILRLEADFGKKAMTKAETLTEFIQYCESNFPADRYALIMWDHGGGSNTGYGYDQKFPNGSMTLDVFNKALMDAGCTFDFIGFDACLMATLETAMVAEQYSDYFIASEETEPGCGWYYTNWLTELSKNTSMDTVSIGKTIIDDYTAACRQQSSSNQTTLSLIDLAELSGTVPEAFNKFASSTVELIDSDSYTVVSNARSRAKEFSSGINQIDLINFADNMGTPEAKALSEALRGCIKYNRVSKVPCQCQRHFHLLPLPEAFLHEQHGGYIRRDRHGRRIYQLHKELCLGGGGRPAHLQFLRLSPHLPVRGYERQRQQRRYAFRAALRGAFRQRQLSPPAAATLPAAPAIPTCSICSRVCAR